MLNDYKIRLTYLSTLPESVHCINISSMKDNIALLKLSFEYIVWYQPNRNIHESQITYYKDEEE